MRASQLSGLILPQRFTRLPECALLMGSVIRLSKGE